MGKYYLGIDIGGTFIKGAVVNCNGEIVSSDKIATECELGNDRIVENIKILAERIVAAAELRMSDIIAAGMGSPGIVDGEHGIVICSKNLDLNNFPLAELASKALGVPVKVANDANAAAFGEHKFGAASAFKSSIFITLGTGVGGGIVIDGKLFEGNKGAGAELGHAVIVAGGEPCTCGRRGCLEAYASATALIRDTRRAMEAHPESALWKVGGLDAVNGKTAFDYYDEDEFARAVVDGYIEKLACGIVNLANEFRPEAIILGGGVCAQGKALTDPLKKIMEKEIFAYDVSPRVELLIASLGNDAGCLGAAALVID